MNDSNGGPGGRSNEYAFASIDRQMEHATANGIDWVRRMIDLIPIAAYTCDADGYVDYYNDGALEAWGRTPRSRDPGDRFCGCFRLTTPDGEPVPKDECWMAQAMLQDRVINGGEIVVVQPNGERLTVLAHARPMHDSEGKVIGAVNVLADITDRKRVEHERQRFVSLVEHSADLIAIVESDFSVSYLNRAGQDLLAIDESEVSHGLPIDQLFPAHVVAQYTKEILPEISAGNRWSGEVTIEGSDHAQSLDSRAVGVIVERY